MSEEPQIVVAEGPLQRMKELQGILASSQIRAEVIRPDGESGNK